MDAINTPDGTSHVAGRVVVGVHGTPGSLQALRFAVGQARALGARLVPVIAWEPPGGDSAGRRYPPFLCDEWADQAEHRLLTAFEEGLGGAPQDVDTLPLVIRGQVGRVLVTVADRENDLLVLGHSRHGAMHRLMYGSPTGHCLARARCTVTIVPPSALARYADRGLYAGHAGRSWPNAARMRWLNAVTGSVKSR